MLTHVTDGGLETDLIFHRGIDLPDFAAHHALRVLRLRPGEQVAVFNGEGGEWAGEIAEIHKARVAVQVHAYHPRDVEATLQVVE